MELIKVIALLCQIHHVGDGYASGIRTHQTNCQTELAKCLIKKYSYTEETLIKCMSIRKKR